MARLQLIEDEGKFRNNAKIYLQGMTTFKGFSLTKKAQFTIKKVKEISTPLMASGIWAKRRKFSKKKMFAGGYVEGGGFKW